MHFAQYFLLARDSFFLLVVFAPRAMVLEEIWYLVIWERKFVEMHGRKAFSHRPMFSVGLKTFKIYLSELFYFVSTNAGTTNHACGRNQCNLFSFRSD